MLLETYGYEVAVASSGYEALDKIALQHLDLLISDCTMPGMRGLELSRKVKAGERSGLAPILLMSGYCSVIARGDSALSESFFLPKS